MAGQPTVLARVCLAVPPPASAALLGCVVGQSELRRPVCDENSPRIAFIVRNVDALSVKASVATLLLMPSL